MSRAGMVARGLLMSGLCSVGSIAGPAAHADAQPDCDPADRNQVRLQISVSRMHSAKGSINITIYPDDARHFLDGKYKLARQHFPVSLPVTHACMVVAAPGNYAVALFHDENDNNHLDKTLVGLPAEGYGFSNNPPLFLHPPELADVLFTVHVGDNPVAIKIKY